MRALEAGTPLSAVDGLSFRDGATVPADAGRARSARSPADAVRLPKRSARVLDRLHLLGRPIDVVETSRGCTFDCSFCSIIEMRGRNFHTWSIERVLDDIADARARGARAIFLVDDNITLNIRAVRGAVPRDRRQPASTTSTISSRR